MKTKIKCVSEPIPEKITEFFESDQMDIYYCQRFNPIIKKYCHQKIENARFNNNFKLLNLTPLEEQNPDEIIIHPKKRIFWGVIELPNKDVIKKKIFIKMTPILEPTNYLMKKDIEQNLLPRIDGESPIQKKIQNIHNCAYVDSFAAFLMSSLVEKELCPSFPSFYGTFNGIAKNYFYDISEEFDSFRQQDWFKIGLLEKRFSHHTVEWDEEEKNRIDFSMLDLEKHSFKSLEPSFHRNIENSLVPELKDIEDLISDNVSLDKLELLEDLLQEDEESSENKDNEDESDESSENKDNEDEKEESSENKDNEDESEESKIESSKNKDNEDVSEESNKIEENDEVKNEECNKIKEIDEDDILLDVDSDLSVCSDELHEGGSHFISLPEFPVQITVSETLKDTLDSLLLQDAKKIENLFEENILDSDDIDLELSRTKLYQELETKWCCYLFQICFGLAVAQKHFDFTHNDLHSNNIMFVETTEEFLYYQIEKKIFRIPTYGVILKIIDFGRAIYRVNNFQYFNDIFSFHNEAGEQYSYPFDDKELMDEVVKPNPSFDLSRLGVSIIDDMYPSPIENSSLYQLIHQWTLDEKGRYVGRFDDFELYKQIARYVHHAVPIEQLKKDIFQVFEIDRSNITIKDTKIYKY